MPKYFAFLRAINVGGRTVKMAELRRHFEQMGFTSVETFIASGNVIFESDGADPSDLEPHIERELRTSLGFETATFIRSLEELERIAGFDPFASENAEGDPVYVAFLRQPPPGDAVARLLDYQNEIDQFEVDGREVYWLARKSISGSTFSGNLLEKVLSAPATIRNVTTLRKLTAKYANAP